VLSLTFGHGVAPQPEFPEPVGIRQLTLTRDVANPYLGR
jgi:hypothetical protein